MLPGGVFHAPPRATGLPSTLVHHSHAFPSMSWIPHVLAAFLPAGCVCPSGCASVGEFSACHATFSNSSAVGLFVAPARQAYSHSTSVGSRYFFPVFCDSHSQYRLAFR